VTRALLLRFVSAIGSATSFYLLLSVVPLFAKAAGAGEGAAGLATSALTFAAVAGELVTARLVTRYGHRWTLAAGLVLLGAPAPLLAVSASTAVIVTVCVVRGIGFGITCVSGGALTASIIPAERRGEGLALLGVVVGVPSMVALPAGLWLAAHLGYGPVFAAGGVAALAAWLPCPGCPARTPWAGGARGVRASGTRPDPAVCWPGCAPPNLPGHAPSSRPPPWPLESSSRSCPWRRRGPPRAWWPWHCSFSQRCPPSPAGWPAGMATGTVPPA